MIHPSPPQIKLRVQRDFFFVLIRNDIRVDNVIMRRLDTRLFGNLASEPIALGGADSRTAPGEEEEDSAGGGGEKFLPPGAVLREWSHSEVEFGRLRERGDLVRHDQIQEVSGMLRGTDLKVLRGQVFAPVDVAAAGR